MKILEYPRHVKLLRRVARPVRDDEFGTDAFLAFTTALGHTMLEQNAHGLASTQVEEVPGGEPWAVFALQVNPGAFGIVANPELLDVGEMRSGPEACLSFMSIAERLEAPEMIRLQGRNPQGAVFETMFAGVAARAAYHEIAHLRGELLIDRMSPLKRRHFQNLVVAAQRKRAAKFISRQARI
jgi:peptide deformylase